MRYLTSLTVLFFCSSALAITTETCPKSFHIDYGQLIPTSNKSLEKQTSGKSGDVVRAFSAARDILKDGHYSGHKNLDFRLIEGKSNECTYQGAAQDVITRLYSRNGKDLLNVSFMLDGHELSVRHDVFSYDQEHLEIEYRPALPLLITLEGQKYKLGWAMGFEISMPKN